MLVVIVKTFPERYFVKDVFTFRLLPSDFSILLYVSQVTLILFIVTLMSNGSVFSLEYEYSVMYSAMWITLVCLENKSTNRSVTH